MTNEFYRKDMDAVSGLYCDSDCPFLTFPLYFDIIVSGKEIKMAKHCDDYEEICCMYEQILGTYYEEN